MYITEERLYEALEIYAPHANEDDVEDDILEALQTIVLYQMQILMCEGKLEFSQEEMQDKVSDMIVGHTLSKMCKAGLIECEMGESRDEDLFVLTDKGREKVKSYD